MKLKIQYFAVFKDLAGSSEEAYEGSAKTPLDLYKELQAKYQFHLESTQLRVAINDQFQPWDAILQEGDKVTFIPPVSGG